MFQFGYCSDKHVETTNKKEIEKIIGAKTSYGCPEYRYEPDFQYDEYWRKR